MTIPIIDANEPYQAEITTRIHAGVIVHHLSFLTAEELISKADAQAAVDEDSYQQDERNWE